MQVHDQGILTCLKYNMKMTDEITQLFLLGAKSMAVLKSMELLIYFCTKK